MYHYVRQLEGSRYPGIKGRRVTEFEGQLEYIAANHTVVDVDQVIAALQGVNTLPDDALWLTFDDGYADHYENVLPALQRRGWKGSFFPPSRAILQGKVLDVNKVHFILASMEDVTPVVDAIREFIEALGGDERVKPFDFYWQELAHANRFDPAEIIFIKRILQMGLPADLRGELTDRLFKIHVSADQAAFAAQLYLSEEQLMEMIEAGMHVGSHGASHIWMDRLSEAEQRTEIIESLLFLEALGVEVKEWVMCYPYGANNKSLHRVLAQLGCVLGISGEVATAQLGQHSPLALPRLDTNDLPLRAGGVPPSADEIIGPDVILV